MGNMGDTCIGIDDDINDKIIELTELAQGKQKQIHVKNDEIHKMQEMLTERDKELSELKSRVTMNEKDINDKKTEIKELDAKCICSMKELKKKEQECKTKDTKIAELNALLIESNKHNKEQDAELKCKSKQIEQLQIAQNDIMKELTLKQQKFNDTNDTLSVMTQKLENKNQQIQKANTIQQTRLTIICLFLLTATVHYMKEVRNTKRKKSQQRKYTERKEETKRGTIGLDNLGNTCWMNSIIQCTSHLPQLVEILKKNRVNGSVTKSFKRIIRDIWSNNTTSISNSLRVFKSKMSSVSSKYGSYNEQDPAEFLDYLMTVLHDELNIATNEYTNNDIIVANGLPDNMVSMLSWTAYLKKNNSPIIDLFYGQHKSSIICANKKCQSDYVIFEPFKMLIVTTMSTKKKARLNNLYDCIEQYVEQNRLKDSKWDCNKCKQDLPNAITQIQLYKFPKILVIALKKSKMQSFSEQPFIDYPVNGLDLTKYDISDSKQQRIYDLFAVSCLSHHHCIAYAKHHINNNWFSFSDSYVKQIDGKNVVVRNAYLLFYQQRN